MNIEHFRKIIEYSDANRSKMELEIKKFYLFAGMNSDQDVRNIVQPNGINIFF